MAVAEIFHLFSDTTFDPERLHKMGEAFDIVSKALPGTSPEEIASHIIDLSRTGIADASVLAAQALEFLASPSDFGSRQATKNSNPAG
jgi:hypothetical protein